MYFSVNLKCSCLFLYLDMLASGDIRDRASNRHHCSCCLVIDSGFYYKSNALTYWVADTISLADDYTEWWFTRSHEWPEFVSSGFSTWCGNIHNISVSLFWWVYVLVSLLVFGALRMCHNLPAVYVIFLVS